MSRRNGFSALPVSLALAGLLAVSAGAAEPPLAVMARYAPLRADQNGVVPYFVNLMALDQLKRGRGFDDVRAYIRWYLANLNYPDRHGCTGTIYDFTFWSDGRAQASGRYDSADSYAATFLMLLRAYVRGAGDISVLTDARDRIRDIAYLIAALQDDDGLCRAIPGSGEKYLMDNCEAYGGMVAFLDLAPEFFPELQAYYRRVADGLRHGIETQLFSPAHADYAWFAEGALRRRPRWRTFYPDALAQLFPLLHGLLDSSSPVARQIWNRFQRFHGRRARRLPVEQRILYSWVREEMTHVH